MKIFGWNKRFKTEWGGDPNLFADPRVAAVLLKRFVEDDPANGSAMQPNAGMGGTSVTDMLRDYISQMFDPSTLQAVVKTLDIIPALRARLDSNDASQQEVAFLLLAKLQDNSVLDTLPKLLGNNISGINPYLLTEAAGLDNARLLQLLLPFLAERNRPQELRSAIADLAGSIGGMEMVTPLLERLNDSSEWEGVRRSAAAALGQIGDTRAAPALLAFIGNPQERSDIRMSALDALVQLDHRAALPTLLERFADKQERAEMRASLAGAIALLGENSAVEPLLAAAQDNTNEMEVVSSALSALGVLGDTRALPVLLEYRNNLIPPMRPEFDEIFTNFDDSQARQITLDKQRSGLKSVKGMLEAGVYQLPVSFHIAGTPPTPAALRWQDLGLGGGLMNLTQNYLPLPAAHAHRQALLTALNTAEPVQRNKLLMALALDETAHFSLRKRAVESVQEAKIASETVTQLKPLTSHANPILRNSAVQAIAGLQSGMDLLPYLEDRTLPMSFRSMALHHFVDTAPREQVIATLLKLAEDDTDMLHPEVYPLLGKLKAKEALPWLQEQLQALEQEQRDWRTQRDQRPTDTADAQTFADWQQALKQAAPKHAYLAAHYAYAMAMIDREQGSQALAHDLADVREGAMLAFAHTSTPEGLQALDAVRQQRANEPMFAQAVFRAIDKGLTRLETTTDAPALKALESWQAAISQRPEADAVKQRLAWTLTMIKHYQTLDNEFKAKYGLERLKEQQ